MLGDWEIARPYNFLLLPMIDPLYGIAFHRKSDEKVLLVCAYSSIQKDWISMECVNVYDGKKCGMLNCRKTAGNIPYNVVFPSQLGQLVIQYQKHPEAKSLAPDGTVCLSDHSKLANGYHLKTGQ